MKIVLNPQPSPNEKLEFITRAVAGYRTTLELGLEKHKSRMKDAGIGIIYGEDLDIVLSEIRLCKAFLDSTESFISYMEGKN